jgi:hypothetical protein
LNEHLCRFPARYAALKAAQVLCSHKLHYADVVFPWDGLAYLSHEWWFSATGRALEGSTTATPATDHDIRLLRDRVDSLELKAAERKTPWYKQLALWLSIISLLISAGFSLYTAYQQQQDKKAEELKKRLETLRATVLEIADLRSENLKIIATPDPTNTANGSCISTVVSKSRPPTTACPRAGSDAWSEWDELYVRILDPNNGLLLREHVRQKRGWYRIKKEDHPNHRPLRVSQLLWRAGRAGTHIGPVFSTIAGFIHETNSVVERQTCSRDHVGSDWVTVAARVRGREVGANG